MRPTKNAMIPTKKISSKLPEKWTPPKLDPVKDLRQTRIVNHILSKSKNFTRNILILARQGQGKSNLSAQLIKCMDTPNIWLRVDDSDVDPNVLMETICLAFKQKFPEFPSEHLQEKALGKTPESRVRLLGETVTRETGAPVCIFFDDIHRLEGSEESLETVSQLGNHPMFRTIRMMNRRSAEIKQEISGNKLVLVEDDHLALSKTEIALFLTRNLQKNISLSSIHNIHRQTKGWIRGIISIASSSPKQDQSLLTPDLEHFFQKNLLGAMNKQQLEMLAIISRLPSIDPDMIDKVTGNKNSGKKLKALADQTLFLWETPGGFTLHPLFRDFLIRREELCGPVKKTRQDYKKGTEAYLKKGDYISGLLCAFESQDMIFADRFLQKHGLSLYTEGRLLSMGNIWKNVTDKVMQNRPYICLYKGVVLLENRNDESCVLLGCAFENFQKQGLSLGALTAACFLIQYYLHLSTHPDRAEFFIMLLETHPMPEQPPPVFLLLKEATLYHAKKYRSINPGEAQIHLNKAREIQKFHNINQGPFETLLMLGVLREQLDQGNITDAGRTLELLIPVLHSGELSTLLKFRIHAAAMLYFTLAGQRSAGLHHKHKLYRSCPEILQKKNKITKELFMLRLERHICNDDSETAHEEIMQALKQDKITDQSHYHATLLLLLAEILSQRGEKNRAFGMMEDAALVREKAGGKKEKALVHLYAGCIHGRHHLFKQGISRLEKTLHMAEQLDNKLLALAANLQKARIYLISKSPALFNEAINCAVAVLKSTQGLTHPRWVTENQLNSIIVAALSRKTCPDYLGTFAVNILNASVSNSGGLIPLLNIKTLGSFSISCGGKELLNSGNLTRIQMGMLSVLLSSPEQQVDIHEMQMIFWPETTGTNARASFNVTLNRLRKTMEPLLHPHDIGNYIQIRDGSLLLLNCSIDTERFFSLATCGMSHFRRGEHWLASNKMREALNCFTGEYLQDIIPMDKDVLFKESRLMPLYSEVIESFCDIALTSAQFCEQDLETIENALSYIQDNPEFIIKLYSVYNRFGKKVKARRMLSSYAAMLRREGFTSFEVQETMNFIQKRLTPPHGSAPLN